MTPQTGIEGRRVLIVEDESLVAMLLETILEDMGCAPVGPASTVEEGVRLVQAEAELSCALLDVNVAGTTVFPVADALKARGVPFVFSTGYGEGGLPDEWRGHPTIQKPFTEATVREALLTAMDISFA
ncbi:MAG: response regulator [Brevundimonas sp.]|uniref:response regulator n=1 Tax=Brevundimonas sp. TaxID=1871086 RepID=UPI0011FB2F19|nr:response regulator [Brevundimonas sp.]RZJ17727.1 MAG: response regulator [Brevundimonas sp.]